MKAGVPWPRKKVKNIRRLRLNLIRVKRQLGRLTQLKQLGVSSSQLDRLFGFWADGPSPGQWWAVRSSNEAMGDGVLVAERAQLLADGAHSLASRALKYSEKNVEREKERERESSGQGKAEFRVVRFPATLIVCEATSDQDGRSRQGEERGEPRGGSEGM
ncbi:hypothetical protein F2Q70_00016072 [Brassica cretica]|uniref:Uncharacterized protein n=1 Tax=Brassica cretica TaxID=69181 RepID=A0A8S9I5K6_BRACR|nr:hypothetical protein F2Q70_00016072 [Brassica cretica]